MQKTEIWINSKQVKKIFLTADKIFVMLYVITFLL